MPNANTIDERVVEMRIDNRQFVKGANQTISVLDKLKDALSFKKASKGFDDISKAANGVDLGGITEKLNEIENKVEYLGSKTRMFIENIIHSIYGSITNFIKSVSIDQLKAGWDKYENLANSIHTIMGATANNWEQTLDRVSQSYGFVGTQMDFVSEQMSKLMWFTDETSASIQDMTNNIGKFTNAGVELDEAAVAMMGISTWGYKSGAGIAEQSRAMYNLSQAMAVGQVKLMDWRSIENANMATIDFKKTVIDAAVEMGTLKKVSDGVYKTVAKGTEVTATNFNEALSEGWFTSDVLMKSLYTYGHFANVLNTVVEDTGVSTRDMLSMVKDYKDGVFDANKWQKKLAETMSENDIPAVESLEYAMELLGKEEDEIGYRAFLASQETKTLGEAIDYTKDAVSSGWMQTWQYIFGNYEEAKEFWGDVTDALYDLFVKAGERRNAIFEVWHDNGGRDALIEAIWNLYDTIMKLVQPIRDAFNDIFGWGSIDEAGNRLIKITEKIRDFTRNIIISEETLTGMRIFFTKFFEKVKVVLGYLKKALSIFAKVFGYITRIFGAFFRAWSSGTFDANKFLTEMNEIFGEIGEKIKNAWEKVKQFVDSLQDVPVVGPVLKFLVNTIEKIWHIFGWIIDKIKGIRKESDGVEGPWDRIKGVFQGLWDKIKSIDIDTQKLKNTFEKISEFVATVWEGLVGDPEEFKKKVKNFFSNAFDGIVEAVKEIDFEKLLQGAKIGIFAYIGIQFASMLSSMTRAVKQIESIPQAIAGVFTSMQDVFRSFGRSIQANIYIKIAIAVALLAASVLMLSQIDDNKFVMVALTLVTMFILLAKAAKSLEGAKMFADNGDKATVLIKGFSKTAMMIVAMAAFLAAAAYAIKQVADLSLGQIIKGLGTIAVICLLAAGVMKYMSDAMNDEQGNLKSLLKLTAIAAAITAAGKAIALLAKLPIAGVMIAAVALSIVLYVMSIIVERAANFQGNGAAAIGTIMMLVVAIYALTLPIIALALLAKNTGWWILVAVGLIAVLMLAITGFMALGSKIGEMPGLKSFAVNLIIVAAAMLVMAIATAIFVPAIIAFIAAIVGLMVLLGNMENFGEMAKRLALFGAALLPLAIVLVLIGAAALLFGLGLLSAGLGMKFFVGGLLKLAIAIALIALAAKFFVQTIDMIVDTLAENGDKFIAALEWILVTVIGLFVAYKMMIANAAVTVILAVVSVITTVGGGELVKLIENLLNKLVLILGTAIGFLVDFLVGFVVYILKRLADALNANRQALVVQIERIIGLVLSIIVEVFGRLLGDILELLFGPIISKLTNGFSIGDWFSQDARAAGDKIAAIFDHSDELEEIGMNSGGTYAQAVVDGAADKGKGLDEVITEMTSSGNKILDDNTVNAYNAGGNFAVATGQGAADNAEESNKGFIFLADSNMQAYAERMGIASPSKVGLEMGKYWDLGIAFGVRDNLSEVNDANDDLATMMQSSLMNAMAIVGGIADEDLAIKPLVKPVVDMTNVSSASSMMSGMFDAYGDMDLGAINARVDAATKGVSAAASSMDAFGEASSSNDSFVINVYSQPGMDENDLANAVMYKIQNGILRKGAALG